jgi:hypothetical protein
VSFRDLEYVLGIVGGAREANDERTRCRPPAAAHQIHDQCAQKIVVDGALFVEVRIQQRTALLKKDPRESGEVCRLRRVAREISVHGDS